MTNLAASESRIKLSSKAWGEGIMAIARRVFAFRRIVANTRTPGIKWCERILPATLLGLCFLVLGSSGCGQTANPVTSPTAGLVDSYFGVPFLTPGSALSRNSSTFDHAANQIGVSGFIISSVGGETPAPILNGTFALADTGFLSITENLATTGTGVISAQNPPLTGAWAVEIPGAGALANLLSSSSTFAGVSVRAAPAAMTENVACPNFSSPASFLYVTVPNSSLTRDNADYGAVSITTQGSAVTFASNPYLIGPTQQLASTVTGGCSNTPLGALTAYPLNSFATPSNSELIGIGASGLLVSKFTNISLAGGLGAFGGGTGVLGVAEPSGPVDVSAVIGAKYNGFFYAPLNNVPETYDITVLASAYGDNTATSQACSALQSSLVANSGQGSGPVPVLPSANSLYGGEFLTTTNNVSVNEPSAPSGSENCDVVIDLGTQDSATNGLFPNATVFIGSNYPPFSANNPWMCGSICATSFPAAAVVGKVQGQFVIFVVASAVTKPPTQLPNDFGGLITQPVGIYLFQKAQ
jgi:hypothetical protein